MSLKQAPNRFERIPKGQVLAWLGHPATAMMIDIVAKERAAAQERVMDLAGSDSAVTMVPIAGHHARYTAMNDVLKIVEEANVHAGS